jgi:hypothetical protein
MATLIQRKNCNLKAGHESKGHTENARNLINEKVSEQNNAISVADNDELINDRSI